MPPPLHGLSRNGFS